MALCTVLDRHPRLKASLLRPPRKFVPRWTRGTAETRTQGPVDNTPNRAGFVGRTAFYRLRQQIQRELGDKFELGRYHEAVLDHGSVPVKHLPELVRARLTQPR